MNEQQADQAAQAEFDWTWVEREELIVQSKLPTGIASDGRPVSANAMAGVLSAINAHLGNNAEAWPSQKHIAQRMKRSTKTVKRACDALQRLSLLIVTPKPCCSGVLNHYRIVWNELKLLRVDHPQPTTSPRPQPVLPSREASDTCPEVADTSREVSDTLSRASDTVSREHHRRLKENHHCDSHSHAKAVPREVVVSVFVDLGIATANRVVADALGKGCSTRHLMAIARWYQRSLRLNPSRWRIPANVLYSRLMQAHPSVAAHKGWLQGDPLPRRRPKKPPSDYRQQRRRAIQEAAQGPSMAEMLRQAQKAETEQLRPIAGGDRGPR